MKKSFKEIKQAETFIFGGLTYVKIDEDKALSFAGVRLFNPEEIIELT